VSTDMNILVVDDFPAMRRIAKVFARRAAAG
jgi:hypothetical protein